MAAPSVSTSSPLAGANDVFINVNPTITFAAGLTTSSVSVNTVFLTDLTNNERVPVTTSYNSSTFTVTLTLSGLLRENTPYRILMVGTDLKVSTALTSADTTELPVSLVIEFTTGDELYDIDTTVEKEAQSKTLEGDLFLPSNVKALGFDFTISKVRPENHSHNVPINLTGDKTVRFTFNKALHTGAFDYTTWLDIETYPLFHDNYLAVSGAIGATTLPSGAVTVTGSELVVTMSSFMPNNAGCTIQLKDGIQALSGDLYGGDLTYTINSQLYPDPFPVRTIKREVRPLPTEDVYNDYVGALLHKNVILLWEMTNRAIDITGLSWSAKKYTLYATILDLIEDADYAKFLTAGTRRQLGDLNVSTDSLIGRLAMKIGSVTREKERALHSLNRGWQFKTAVRAEGSVPGINRLWYDINGRYTSDILKYKQPNAPMSNTSAARHAKTNNPAF